MLPPFVIIIALLFVSVAVALELKRDLMMLQQNSYRNERYIRWISSSGDTTSVVRLCGFVILLFSLSRFGFPKFTTLLITAYALFVIVKLLRAKYKKPVVFTARATRIYSVSLAIAVCVAGGVGCIFIGKGNNAILSASMLTMLGLYCASHVVTYLSNLILSPYQSYINRKFYNKAASRLASVPDLHIVGITGSYGKTSTKHYLHAILSEHFDVLMTPGSFNTTLGVVRTVNEMLKPYNQVFIVEMGAKQTGDIREICDLVHPQIGIVTAVGPQHLETFHTIENVRNTKFELVDSLPADGLAVLNDDFPMIRTRRVNNTEAVRYSIAGDNCSPDARFVASDIVYTPEGTTFKITDRSNGKEMQLTTSLVGRCNISNLMAAVIVALHLGVPESKIRYAVGRIEQVSHRLNIKHTAAGITIIDDAYNSNPVGSAMALEVLSTFTSGRRIVITPGMIELGEDQKRLNFEFGQNIPLSADIAYVVGHYNREAITEGIKDADKDGRCRVKVVDTFAEAQQLMLAEAMPGDVVLYENDLPDTFK